MTVKVGSYQPKMLKVYVTHLVIISRNQQRQREHTFVMARISDGVVTADTVNGIAKGLRGNT